jgi:hypothetical protein
MMLPEEYKEYAEILVHQWPNPLGGEPTTSFEWKGPINAPVEIGWDFSRKLGGESRLPWRLKKIGTSYHGFAYIYVREDIPLFPKTVQWLETRWLAHCRAFNTLEARIVLTAHVWGLAYVHPNEEPRWSCLGRRR